MSTYLLNREKLDYNLQVPCCLVELTHSIGGATIVGPSPFSSGCWNCTCESALSCDNPKSQGVPANSLTFQVAGDVDAGCPYSFSFGNSLQPLLLDVEQFVRMGRFSTHNDVLVHIPRRNLLRLALGDLPRDAVNLSAPSSRACSQIMTNRAPRQGSLHRRLQHWHLEYTSFICTGFQQIPGQVSLRT